MPWQLVHYRWGSDADPDQPLPSFARPCIEIPGSQRHISADVARCDLPLAGQWQDQNGRAVFRYELPGGCCQVPDSDEEQIMLRIPNDTERVAISIRLSSRLPAYSSFARAADDEAVNRTGGERWPPSTLSFAHAVNRSLGLYVEFVSELHDHPEPSAGDWDGRERHNAVCSIFGLAERWGKITALDAPPSALIVRIARRLPPVLETICAKPRCVLRRERVLTPIAQIQELDVASLRWISRQPGRTLAEKAGHKQQLQSVRRFENADILENRVVREFLILCILAARRYEAENERFLRDDGENAVKLVLRYRRRCQQLLQESPIGAVKRLGAVPPLNYVLQHEPSYRLVWNHYQLLLRQQRQEEHLWRWRHRTWSEICYLAVTVALQELCPSSPAQRTDFVIRDEQHTGQFLDRARSLPADWWREHREGGGRDIIQLRSFIPGRDPPGSLLGMPGLDSLCPDFVLVRRRASDVRACERVVPCWTVFLEPDSADRLSSLASNLLQLLSACGETTSLSGCILCASDTRSCSVLATQHAGPVSAIVVQLPRDLWTASDSFRDLIQGLLFDYDSA